MKKSLYLLLLAGASLLASFRGGAVSWLLFYFALLLPAASLLYTLYGYFRLRLIQETERTAVKAREVPYRLIAANEGLLPLLDVRLLFYADRVRLQGGESLLPDKDEAYVLHLCLMPRQTARTDIHLYCKYRGTYPVGVKKVCLSDFLGLFTIPYPLRSHVRVSVKPRILPLDRLLPDLHKQDPKSCLFSFSRRQELPDFELRAYQPGDPPRYIHWKSSARTGELLVRRQLPEELFETVVILDLFPLTELPEEQRLQTEDNILEAALAFLHDFYEKQIPVRAVWQDRELTETVLDASTCFDLIYGRCSDLLFRSSKPLEEVWTDYLKHRGTGRSYILITARISDSLRRLLSESRRLGNEVTLINAGELSL